MEYSTLDEDVLGILLLCLSLGIVLPVMVWHFIGRPFWYLYDVYYVRQKRREALAEVAEQLRWDFEEKCRLRFNDFVRERKKLNAVQKEIEEGVWLYVFDVPVEADFDLFRKEWVEFSLADTLLVVEFPRRVEPFSIRRRTWLDGKMDYRLATERMVIEGNELGVLKELFDEGAVAHYEEVMDALHVETAGRSIGMWYGKGGYLPASKEQYWDLIAEGKYIAHLMQRYLERRGVDN